MSNTDERQPRSASSFLSPASFIRAVMAARPEFKWALAAAGLLAIVVIFSIFGTNYATLIFGSLALLSLMILFVLFSQVAKLRRSRLETPARVLIWAILLTLLAFIVFLTSSTFFDAPLPFKSWIVRKLIAPGVAAPMTPNIAPSATLKPVAAPLTPLANPSPLSQIKVSTGYAQIRACTKSEPDRIVSYITVIDIMNGSQSLLEDIKFDVSVDGDATLGRDINSLSQYYQFSGNAKCSVLSPDTRPLKINVSCEYMKSGGVTRLAVESPAYYPGGIIKMRGWGQTRGVTYNDSGGDGGVLSYFCTKPT